jgi:hypothetical protein
MENFTDVSFHEMAKWGEENWAVFSSFKQEQEEEYSHMIRFQINRRNSLRYTPLHSSIFIR